MAARGQLAAERNGREGMTGVAERGDEDPPCASSRLGRLRPDSLAVRQSISASSRIVRLRCSGSNAIGDTISVPTPAAR
jgi:hypothetical protein